MYEVFLVCCGEVYWWGSEMGCGCSIVCSFFFFNLSFFVCCLELCE